MDKKFGITEDEIRYSSLEDTPEVRQAWAFIKDRVRKGQEQDNELYEHHAVVLLEAADRVRDKQRKEMINDKMYAKES